MFPNVLTDKQVLRIHREIQRANAATEADKHDEAKEILSSALAEARKLGFVSAYLHWSLSVACDNLGHLADAVHHIREAVRLDPVAGPFRRSLDIVRGRVESALLASNPEDPDSEILDMYEGLKSLGGAEAPVHLAVARHLGFRGKKTQALELVRAVLLLAPTPEAVELEAKLSGELGEPAALLSPSGTRPMLPV